MNEPKHDSWCATEHSTIGQCNCHLLTINQMSINFTYLMGITDSIAEIVAPNRLGSWQQRAEWALSETSNCMRKAEAYKQEHRTAYEAATQFEAQIAQLQAKLEAANEDVRVLARAICEAAIVVEALEMVERGGTALCPEMQTQITIAASGMRCALARPTVRAIVEGT